MNTAELAAADAAGEADFMSAFAEAATTFDPVGVASDAAGVTAAAAVVADTLQTDGADAPDSQETAGTKPAGTVDTAPAAPAAGTETAGRASPPPADELAQRLVSADPLIAAAFAAATQATKSDRGRIAAMQRQIAELKATTARVPAAPDTSGTSAEMADLLDDPALREATEAYGDVLNPLLAVMRKMQTRLDTVAGTVTADQSARAERAAAAVIEAEEVAVRGAHSDLDAIINSQDFADWAKINPQVMPTIRANGDKIVDAEAVTGLLDQFKRETAWAAPTSPAPTPRANPNDARRARQIASTVQAKTGGTGTVASKGTDSFDDAFAEAAAKFA